MDHGDIYDKNFFDLTDDEKEIVRQDLMESLNACDDMLELLEQYSDEFGPLCAKYNNVLTSMSMFALSGNPLAAVMPGFADRVKMTVQMTFFMGWMMRQLDGTDLSAWEEALGNEGGG